MPRREVNMLLWLIKSFSISMQKVWLIYPDLEYMVGILGLGTKNLEYVVGIHGNQAYGFNEVRNAMQLLGHKFASRPF